MRSILSRSSSTRPKGASCSVVLLFTLGVSACASGPHLSFAVEQRLLRETTLDDMPAEEASAEEDAVVRVVQMGAGASRCSGALIDPRHVLTAAHCVARRDEHHELTLVEATAGELHVELGGDYLPWGRVGVVGLRTCDGYAGDLEHDIAVLVLSSPVPFAVRPLTLDWMPPQEDTIYALHGFGSSRPATAIPGTSWSSLSLTRHASAGPAVFVDDQRIFVGMTGVPGDSGGPIVNVATHRIVSVVARGRASDEAASAASAYPYVGGAQLSTCKKAIVETLAR